MDTLGVDVCALVARTLSVTDVKMCRLVSREWKHIFTSDAVWRMLRRNRYTYSTIRYEHRDRVLCLECEFEFNPSELGQPCMFWRYIGDEKANKLRNHWIEVRTSTFDEDSFNCVTEDYFARSILTSRFLHNASIKGMKRDPDEYTFLLDALCKRLRK